MKAAAPPTTVTTSAFTALGIDVPPHYAQELAGLFHQFYTNCHILGEEPAVQNARLALADATRIVLALTLSLLGVSAPERM